MEHCEHPEIGEPLGFSTGMDTAALDVTAACVVMIADCGTELAGEGIGPLEPLGSETTMKLSLSSKNCPEESDKRKYHGFSDVSRFCPT